MNFLIKMQINLKTRIEKTEVTKSFVREVAEQTTFLPKSNEKISIKSEQINMVKVLPLLQKKVLNTFYKHTFLLYK